MVLIESIQCSEHNKRSIQLWRRSAAYGYYLTFPWLPHNAHGTRHTLRRLLADRTGGMQVALV